MQKHLHLQLRSTLHCFGPRLEQQNSRFERRKSTKLVLVQSLNTWIGSAVVAGEARLQTPSLARADAPFNARNTRFDARPAYFLQTEHIRFPS